MDNGELAELRCRVAFLERVAEELIRREFDRLGPYGVGCLRMLHPAASEEEIRLRALQLWEAP